MLKSKGRSMWILGSGRNKIYNGFQSLRSNSLFAPFYSNPFLHSPKKLSLNHHPRRKHPRSLRQRHQAIQRDPYPRVNPSLSLSQRRHLLHQSHLFEWSPRHLFLLFQRKRLPNLVNLLMYHLQTRNLSTPTWQQT